MACNDAPLSCMIIQYRRLFYDSSLACQFKSTDIITSKIKIKIGVTDSRPNGLCNARDDANGIEVAAQSLRTEGKPGRGRRRFARVCYTAREPFRLQAANQYRLTTDYWNSPKRYNRIFHLKEYLKRGHMACIYFLLITPYQSID